MATKEEISGVLGHEPFTFEQMKEMETLYLQHDWEGYKQSGSKFSWDDIRNWINPKLKSIRPQNRWKPSDEQMVALKHAFNDGSIDFADMKILGTLYEQLKALHRYEQDT